MKFLLIPLLLTTTLQTFAQTPEDWGAVNQRLDVSSWQGLRFKLSAAVRATVLDPEAGAEIWVRIDKLDKKMGFFYNMMDKPIRDSQWKTVTIQGRIDKDARYISFGGLYQHKGIFYFDDFHLRVEKNKSQWLEIPIPDAGFETDTSTLNAHWKYLMTRSFFTSSLTYENPFEGRTAFKVDGTRFVRRNTFGNNDSTGRYAAVNGIKIYYETYGQGAPLLLLHGNSESIVSFKQQIPELFKKYKVIAVDTRGQGKSSENGQTYTYDLFAEDMNALLDHLHLDSVNILGWSDGGNTGLIMAMKYPAKVRRLAAMGANVYIDHSVVGNPVFHTLHKYQRELRDDSTAHGRNRDRLITLLLTEPRHRFEDLQTIQCPVLVMAGQHDVIKEPHTRQIAAHIKNSQLLIFPGGTHEEPSEHPDLFNKAVLDFFAGN